MTTRATSSIIPTSDLDLTNLPAHIAIIMDGNGRWAQKKGVPRTMGHKQGIETAKIIIKHAIDLHIPYLTLYVFSTENWKRPAHEVSFLMKLILDFIKRESDFYKKNDIHLRHSGDLSKLPKNVAQGIRQCLADTVNNKAITVNLALNYGGRDEIIRAFNRWLNSTNHTDTPLDAVKGPSASDGAKNFTTRICTPADVTAHLDNPDIPDPDLIIRTAGEMRISNYLLWQSAYSELYFSSVLWPDWGYRELMEALKSYQQRSRKFGGVK